MIIGERVLYFIEYFLTPCRNVQIYKKDVYILLTGKDSRKVVPESFYLQVLFNVI